MAILENDGNLDRATEVEGYKVLPPCVLYGKIGQGGMGAVYRGRHLNLDIDVAVKCLKPGLVGGDDQFVVRFRREARSAAQINHQNVIRVFDVAEDQGLHYLIMELVQGETARERVVRKQKLGIGEALEIVYGASQGLAEAHRKGFIHRDIKPDNIMISSSGQVKVADLGLAKPSIRDDNASMLSGTNLVMGTPQYMPPEQWENTANVTAAADVWALGATLYYLLVGGEAIQKDSLPRIMQRIMLQPFPDPRRQRPDVPADVAALVAKATSLAIEDRYQDAQELAEAIEKLETRRDALRDKDAVPTSRVDSLLSPPPAKTLAKIKFWLDKQGPNTAAEPAQGPGGTMVVHNRGDLEAPLAVAPPQRAWLKVAVAGIGIVLLVLLIAWLGSGRRNTGVFAEVERLEALGQFEAAITEVNRVHMEDPSLRGKAERLAGLTAAWARELAVHGAWREALVQIERSRSHFDAPATRDQKKDLLARIQRGLDGKLVRTTPDSRPLPLGVPVEFSGRLDDPIVTALRIGGAPADWQNGPFRLALDCTGKTEVPIEVTLTNGDILALSPWPIQFASAPVTLAPVALNVEPASVVLEEDKPAELLVRVTKGTTVTIDGALQPTTDDGTVVRYQVRSKEANPAPIVVVARKSGFADATRTVLVQRATKVMSWLRPVEVPGGKVHGNLVVTKDATIRLLGRPSERATTVLVNGSALAVQWTDSGVFEGQLTLPAVGRHMLHIELQRPFRASLTQELPVVLVGEPTLELAPPSRDGDISAAATYPLVLTVDAWTTSVTARRGGILLKAVEVAVGTTSARLEVVLQSGQNEIDLEVLNIVGLKKTRRITLQRTSGGGAGNQQATPHVPTEVAEIDSVMVEFAGAEHLVPKNGTIRVPTGARLRVVSADATAVVVCKDKDLVGDELVLSPSAFMITSSRGNMPELRLRNAVGVSRTPFKFKIVFDDQAPDFVVVSPVGPVGLGVPFTCQGTWTDNCALSSITVNGLPATGADERSERGQWTIELPPIQGPVEYEAVFTDVAGNQTRRMLKFTP